MERWVAKVISLFGILVVIMVCVLLPIKLSAVFIRKGRTGLLIISALNCLGGGVFFGTYLLHMAPEVRELLDVTLLKPRHIDYPIPELIIGLGFFLVLFMEKSVMSCTAKVSPVEEKSEQEEQTVSNGGTFEDGVRLEPIKTISDSASNGNVSSAKTAYENDILPPNGLPSEKETKGRDISQQNHGHGHSHGIPQGDANAPPTSSIRSLILLMALSLHCIFEGMAVGLKRTNQGVWNLFIAIVVHEAVIAFSLGLQLVKSYRACRVVLAGVLYSLMTPIGVAIGTSIMETQGGNSTIDMVSGFLQGIAAGTFIYVTFFEILEGEISHETSWLNMFVLLLGFAVMAGLSAIPEGNDKPVNNGNATYSIMERSCLFCY